MLFTTAGAEGNISGVILSTDDSPAGFRRPAVVKVLDGAGIIPTRSTRGTTPLARAPGEHVTDGLDGLRPARRIPRAPSSPSGTP
jgi:hypothetical protein